MARTEVLAVIDAKFVRIELLKLIRHVLEGGIVEHRGEVERPEELVEDLAIPVLALLLFLRLLKNRGLLEKFIVERRIFSKEVIYEVACAGERIPRAIVATSASLLSLTLVRDLLLLHVRILRFLLGLSMLWQWAPKLIALQICVAEVLSSIPDLWRATADVSPLLAHLRHTSADVLSPPDGHLRRPEIFLVLLISVSDVGLSVTAQFIEHTDAFGGLHFLHIVEGHWFLHCI